MGPATCCYDSALLFNHKLQLRVPCVSLCLIASLVRGAGIKQTCLSITSSASGAGGFLAMSWLNWPRRLAKTHEEMVGLRKSQKYTKMSSTMALKHAKGDWDCTILQDFAVFFMPEAAMHSDCLVCSLCWQMRYYRFIACFVQGPGIKPTCLSITSTSSAIRA